MKISWIAFSICALLSLPSAFADRGGVSGGGGGDGSGHGFLIDPNGDQTVLYLQCPHFNEIYQCTECNAAITSEGNIDQQKLDGICDLRSR